MVTFNLLLTLMFISFEKVQMTREKKTNIKCKKLFSTFHVIAKSFCIIRVERRHKNKVEKNNSV